MRREQIREMFGGKCAYCGCVLGKTFHVDHVAPIYRGWKDKPEQAGVDDADNLFPACPRCNLWKKTFSVDQFRGEIATQTERLRRDSAPFRLAEDFGMVETSGCSVVFWFEKYTTSLPTPSTR